MRSLEILVGLDLSWFQDFQRSSSVSTQCYLALVQHFVWPQHPESWLRHQCVSCSYVNFQYHRSLVELHWHSNRGTRSWDFILVVELVGMRALRELHVLRYISFYTTQTAPGFLTPVSADLLLQMFFSCPVFLPRKHLLFANLQAFARCKVEPQWKHFWPSFMFLGPPETVDSEQAIRSTAATGSKGWVCFCSSLVPASAASMPWAISIAACNSSFLSDERHVLIAVSKATDKTVMKILRKELTKLAVRRQTSLIPLVKHESLDDHNRFKLKMGLWPLVNLV